MNFDVLDPADAIAVDFNEDGIDESLYYEIDTDGDGVVDTTMLHSDTDGDGIIDRLDTIAGRDTDGDGIQDVWTVETDLDGDGVNDESYTLADTDGDGIVDAEFAADEMAVGNADIVGNPESDIDNWHWQTKSDTCAVACQEFILDEMTGRDFTEDELTQIAIDNGWYNPGGGTPIEHVGNLLEAHGIEVEKEYDCTFDDLSDKLTDGENVIVAIDCHETWYPSGLDSDEILANVAGMPEQGANHAVQVIGIDNSDPDNPVVILNDPGIPHGRGVRVDADDFRSAWEDSDRYMVSTVS